MIESNIRSTGARALCCAAAIAVGCLMWTTALWAERPTELPPMVHPPEIRAKIQKMGAGGLALARQLGITEVAGKSTASGPPGNANAKKLKDVPVGADPFIDENEPTIAASPTNKKRLVAGNHYYPDPTGTNRCAAYTSADKGATWSAPVLMPQLTENDPANDQYVSCSDPVLAYAPDGSRVYYAYMDIKDVFDFTNFPASITLTEDLDIVVSFSNDDGATWTGPVVALNGDSYEILYTPCPPPYPPGYYCGVLSEPGFVYDKNWVGAPLSGNPGQVYVTATQFDVGALTYPNAIAFAGSSDGGYTWGAPVIMDIGGGAADVVVQGSRPAGGPGCEVLVAWYHSAYDGWLNGAFQIRTRRSPDCGATWQSRVVAAVEDYELPYWLGPYFVPDPFGGFYKRWWGGMFPDPEIGPNGSAHIVYTRDPVSDFASPEDGDVRYIRSPGPPHDAWSAPMMVNDDGMERAQGYAALKLQHGDAYTDPHVHVIWEDTRLSPDLPIVFPDSPNLYYDMFYARMVPGQTTFFQNVRVSEVSSIQDYVFTGDYHDLASNSTLLYGIWTDRRDKLDIFDFPDDTYGSQIIAGGATTK